MLVLNPLTDRTFGSFAERELDGARDMNVFEARLRVRYPAAAVHARILTGEPIAIWYVYRDGHWTNAPKAHG